MKRYLLLVVAWFTVGSAVAQNSDAQRRTSYRAKMERLWAIEKRINETRPQRRDAPLRQENIRDEEVREILGAARGIVPEAIVNISGVVTGCPCEEGPTCSDQVWILASTAEKTLGLQLSKIGNAWTIGLIQRWWFEYEALQTRRTTFRSYSEYRDAENTLTEKFPMCAAASEKAKGSR